MSTLPSELNRLYLCGEPNPAGPTDAQFPFVDPDGRVRAMVLELARPADWKLFSTVWRGVQTDLELPAPAIAVNGIDGYQLWFSVAEPVPVYQAFTFLEALRLRFLRGVAPERIVMSPPRNGALADRLKLVPAQRQDTGLWSAFVAPDLAAIFSDEPWLDVSPSAEAQVKILAQLECIPSARFHALLEDFRPRIEAESGALSSRSVESHNHPVSTGSSPPLVPAAVSTPKQFLLDVMNDSTVELHLRIDAARALLPYS